MGLVEPPTWNERTGNIVAGHQRVAGLDDLEGTQDYFLDVAAVSLDDKQERQQNVFMNNPTAQGDYDMTVLATLLKQDDFDKTAAGFDRLDLETVFSDDELASMFKLDAAGQAVMKELGSVGGIKTGERAASEPTGAAAAGDGERGPGDDEDDDGGDDNEPDEQPLAAAGQRRSDAVKEFMASKDAGNDTETYAVVVFTTRREREIFMACCGQDANTRYIDGVKVFSKLGIDPTDAAWAQQFDQPAA